MGLEERLDDLERTIASLQTDIERRCADLEREIQSLTTRVEDLEESAPESEDVETEYLLEELARQHHRELSALKDIAVELYIDLPWVGDVSRDGKWFTVSHRQLKAYLAESHDECADEADVDWNQIDRTRRYLAASLAPSVAEADAGVIQIRARDDGEGDTLLVRASWWVDTRPESAVPGFLDQGGNDQ